MSGTYIDNQGNEIIIGGAANNSFKANINLDNINAEGKHNVSTLSCPSDRYDDLTLLASGQSYTAPANGMFLLRRISTGAGQYVLGLNTITDDFDINWAVGADKNLTARIRVKKGAVVRFDYSAPTAARFRFIYDEGEV